MNIERGATCGRTGRLPIDLTGQRFGHLIVIALHGSVPDKRTKFGRLTWQCRCDCGGTRITRGDALKSGATQSCGCLQAQAAAVNLKQWFNDDPDRKGSSFRHGHARTTGRGKASRTYMSWIAMRQRCGNSNHARFPNYGGRGIAVCARWQTSFDAFLADMGERPAGKTLDRRDPDGDYEPGNCRWATPREQWANRRGPILGGMV